MARPRNYKIEEILAKIREYRLEHPTEMLKARPVSDYLKQNGYPIEPYTIKRTAEFRDELDKLNKGSVAEMLATIAMYKKLDIDQFFRKHRTPESIRNALTTLDAYYGALAASAAAAIKEKDKLTEDIRRLRRQNNELKAQMEDATKLKEEIRNLKKEVSALRTILDKYVYPDAAKTLLSDAGLPANSIVDPEKVAEITVNEGTVFNAEILNDIAKEIM